MAEFKAGQGVRLKRGGEIIQLGERMPEHDEKGHGTAYAVAGLEFMGIYIGEDQIEGLVDLPEVGSAFRPKLSIGDTHADEVYTVENLSMEFVTYDGSFTPQLVANFEDSAGESSHLKIEDISKI